VLELGRRGHAKALPRGPPAAGCSSAAEVLRRDLVEEVLELVDDLFGVLDLVLELDRRLRDDLLGGEDRRAERTASARASLGRESISTSRPLTVNVIDA
jgi:hypothetical protein